MTHGIIGGVMAHEGWSRGSAPIARRLGIPGPVGEKGVAGADLSHAETGKED